MLQGEGKKVVFINGKRRDISITIGGKDVTYTRTEEGKRKLGGCVISPVQE